MSTTILPDIYRHTARKSTVSRNVKPTSKIHTFNNNNNNNNNNVINTKNFKEEQSIFDAIECNIKFEKDLAQSQRLIILPENEIEQMNVEQNHETIIANILDDILKQIPDQIINSDQHRTNSTDIRHVMNSLVSHIDESNTDNTTVNDVQMEDMQLNQDDDIVEIEPLNSNLQSRSCSCQCHQSTSQTLISNSTNDYFIFEQALRQTRQEHQETIQNNQVLQTLKDQHNELMKLYHRQLHLSKIDREQQTNLFDQHDQFVQTDISTITPLTQVQQVNGTTHMNSNAKVELTVPRVNNHFAPIPVRTTGPSLQQIIPCLTTTNPTMIKKQPQPVSTSNSHDIVDLTEEDEEQEEAEAAAAEEEQGNDEEKMKPNGNPTRTLPPKVSPVPIVNTHSLQQPGPPLATRNQPIIRSNLSTIQNVQSSIRPLIDHNPCDYAVGRPQLSIAHDNSTVRLTWNLPGTPMESILNYEIFAYKQNHNLTNSDWKKIGTVKSMRLPMAVTLKEFQSNSHYAFAVRAISINNNFGPFCEPKTIFTGNSISDQRSST